MPQVIATIARLYIYPVKSMAGILVDEAYAGLDGILGDRQYSFIRADQSATNSFPWMTARQSTRMLLYHPQFEKLPSPGEAEPRVQIRTPEGDVHDPDNPALREALEQQLGKPLYLLKSARGLFDCQHISLFSLASVSALAAEVGGAIDPRQFRANIYLQPASGQPFEEERWGGALLRIGNEVLTGVTQRDSRCMMINLNPDTAEQNAQVLKTVVQKHEGQAGIYVNVIRPGRIRVGDPVSRIENP